MENIQAEFPTKFWSERLRLRCYEPGDGKWYYAMSLRNREHLRRYESGNVAANLSSEEVAEALMCDLAADWQARKNFFIAAFNKLTNEFVAQIYVGPVSWELPEFQIGYFVDVNHEGQGYVTEAVKATLRVIFGKLNAHRVRLFCDKTNLRSMRVAERCGMTREAHLRENKKNADGSYSGTLIYGLLRSEFRAR